MSHDAILAPKTQKSECCKGIGQSQGCLQTPGGRENGEASLDAHKGTGDQGIHPVVIHGPGGNVKEASSNGGSDLAPAHITEPVRGALRDP